MLQDGLGSVREVLDNYSVSVAVQFADMVVKSASWHKAPFAPMPLDSLKLRHVTPESEPNFH